MFFLLLTNSLSLKPLYLVAGFGQSPIYGTVTQPELYPECPANMVKTMIRTATAKNDSLINNYPDCIAKLLQVQLNSTTGQVEQLPGLITDSSPIGEASLLSSTFGTIISKAKELGYTDNEDLFSVGYNYYLHPITSNLVYDKLKEKIEEVYNKKHEKAILISFSQGTSFISIFVSNYSTKSWVERYIDSIVFVAPAFAGWPTFSQLYDQNMSPYKTTDEMKKTVMRMPGLHIMMPNYVVFENFTVIYNLYNDYDQHNASFSFEFLKMQEKVDDDSEKIFKAHVEKFLKEPIPEPPVPSLVIYNDNIKMTVSYSIYQHRNKIVKSIYSDPGDGTVTSEGAQFACGRWKTAKCLNLRDSSNHAETLSDSKTIETLFDFIQSDNKTIENKIGLFMASGFQGSPLYGSVTDPEKVPMCPSNMKNYIFYSIYFGNVYELVDSDSKYWLSDECKAMLTRVELSEDESHATFAPGIHLTSSRIGQYDRLDSYSGIIERAYREGWTHYRDLFGVGYNYMLHPLMSGETFEDVKIGIEKHFNETGKKSVLTGHSQGTSFVEIFITDYVTSEWAKKYMAGVIFYAPAFAGWGTYGRSVSGNYGSGFPDGNPEMRKSTQRMPGLHIMMPNEGVFGNTTVIKDFPNDGDQSNATFVSSLLQKLEKMDETAYKVFKLTDKYRKPPLPEPPVPSLVIFNNASNTADGYTYQKLTNSVSSFNGHGDGVVSDDGPLYVCSHWANVTCYNYRSTDIGHSNIQTQLITYDLTFNFIERVQDYKPYPKDKTVSNEAVSGKYANSSYVESHRVPNNLFSYSANEGTANHPLSNAFDDNAMSYYISSVSNNISYHNNITIEFSNIVTIEAFLYDTCYSTSGTVRNFQGFPSVLNVYTSCDGSEFELNTVFIGIPVYPSTRIQFVLKKPAKIDKLKLEFAEVSTQTIEGYSRNPCISNLIFIESMNESDILSFKGVEGDYADDVYVNSHLISTSEFELTADKGLDNYPLSNLFDNDKYSFWISSKANSATFHNTMVFDFSEEISLEAFLYDSAYNTKGESRTFNGFPTVMKVYVQNEGQNDLFSLCATFEGSPVYPWTRMQFVFKSPVRGKRFKFEFVTVTPQTISQTGQNPVCAGLFLIRHIEPTQTKVPTSSPTKVPTSSPTKVPTLTPTEVPTLTPSSFITSVPDPTPITVVPTSDDSSSDDDESDDSSDSNSSLNRILIISGIVVFSIIIVVVIVVLIIKIKNNRDVIFQNEKLLYDQPLI